MVIVATGSGLVTVDGHRVRPLVDDVAISALDVRADTGTWWAIGDDGVLWRDGEVVGHADVGRPTSLLALDDTVLVGTTGPRLFRRTPDGAFEAATAFDAVATRDKWHAVGTPLNTRSLAAEPHGDVVYAGIHVGGISRSPDRGRSWASTAFAVDDDVHEVHVALDGTLYAAAGVGFDASDDGGRTWTRHNEGFDATYARAVTTSAGHVFASASTGPFTNAAAVYRAPLDLGRPWEPCTELLPDNVDTAHLVADPQGTMVAFATWDGRVVVSDDDGRTWTEAARDLGQVRAIALLAR